jgi:transmembrane sensor
MAAAAVLAVAFVVLWPRRTGSGSAVAAPLPVVGAQEYGRRVLEDGSVVEVKGAAEVATAFTPAERRVRLIRGEAHFTVSRNPLRPFIVSAGGVGVRAVGTAFDVALSGAGVSVLVTEGRVQVSREQGEGPAPVLVSAGFRTEVLAAASSPTPVPVPVSAAQVERYLSWKPRLLEFDNAPLSEIVEGFNRGGAVRLVLADAETGRVRMNLIAFNPKDVDAFVRLADRYYGIRAERKGDTITLRRSR